MVNELKLAASHIAWTAEEEEGAMLLLKQFGFQGLEIAPPRVAGTEPYECPQKVADYARRVHREYGLKVCSMQSIWFGKTGSLFGAERAALLAYSKQAIRFAGAAEIPNLVFGCPKNRIVPKGVGEDEAISFFRELAEEAENEHSCFSLEANPPLYGTNFMNTTNAALEMARRVNHAGCKVNLDVGTMIENEESVEILRGRVREINHVHISEPNLVPIQKRKLHQGLGQLLREEGYAGYVSIEMKSVPRAVLEETLSYICEAFA